MLIAEDVDGLQSYSLDGVNKTITNHIDLDGLPLRVKRVLRNSHLDSILYSIVLGRLGVEE
jgi:hypothetical protein